MSIGAILNDFQKEPNESLEIAAKLGVHGIQPFIKDEGTLSLEQMTATRRREFLAKTRALGLTVSALFMDAGGGFHNTESNPKLIEKTKRTIDLAKDLDADIVATHIGVLPADKGHPHYSIMQEACGKIGEYARSVNARFAIETGPEPAVVLLDFLRSLTSGGVFVNFDPANLVMVVGDDPIQAVHTLRDYIVDTHAKDGKRLRIVEPEIVYGLKEDDGGGKSYEVLPLGEGDVDFVKYVAALKDIGYKGFLTVELEMDGGDPINHIRTAVSFLQNLI